MCLAFQNLRCACTVSRGRYCSKNSGPGRFYKIFQWEGNAKPEQQNQNRQKKEDRGRGGTGEKTCLTGLCVPGDVANLASWLLQNCDNYVRPTDSFASIHGVSSWHGGPTSVSLPTAFCCMNPLYHRPRTF